MRKTCLFLSILLTSVIFISVDGCTDSSDQKVNEENLEKIKGGMTLDEVESVLGRGRKYPGKEVRIKENELMVRVVTYVRDSIEIYVWGKRNKQIIIVFDKGVVFATGRHPEIYTSGL